MIGILLALQVSEWNQARNDRAEETAELSQILVTLENDLIGLEGELTRSQERSLKVEELWDHVLVKGPYRTELNENFMQIGWVTGVEINRAPFENLKSRGLRLVSNDELLLKLTSFYENEYTFLMRRTSNVSEVSLGRVASFRQKHFHWSGEPLNYVQLIEDSEFLYILNQQTTLYKFVIQPWLNETKRSLPGFSVQRMRLCQPMLRDRLSY